MIPCRDDAAMLAVCLAALAAQTLLPFEVIVVDNGSIDESRSVALAAGARVVAAHTGGIPNATALGLDASRGEILARLDADSRPAPDWLERVAADLCDPDGWSAVTGTGEFYGTRRLLAWAGRVLYLGGYFPSLRRHLAWSVNTFALDREQMTLAARRRSRNRSWRRR